MRKIIFQIIIVFVLSSSIFTAQSLLKLPAIFSDNMVLQQNSVVPIWGKGEPNYVVKVFGSWGEIIETKVEEDSSWIVKINTKDAGGPYVITVSQGNENIEFNNVLLGEVWLCSGQSNMEMPLQGWAAAPIQNSKEEIANADNDQIRLFTVSRDIAVSPRFDCVGKWSECTSETASTFSATAYFFGKNLFSQLHVPIGLIHSSWGGTPAEAWTSKKYLSTISAFDSTLKKIDLSIPASKKYQSWLNKFPKIDVSKRTEKNKWSNLNFNDAQCSQINYDDSAWDVMKLPTLWEQANLGEFDGAVWFRKKIELPVDWTYKDLKIELGPIDDFDETFVNGYKVGAIEEEGNWQTKRIYSIPKEMNIHKDLLIAVRVNDNTGGGGIYGNADEMKLINLENNEEISLAGDWRFLPVAEYSGTIYYIFGADPSIYKTKPVLPIIFSQNTPTFLYNAMISPLIPFAIKGVIWYQGEANTGNPQLYETLFPTMIKNWRNDFGNDFPFYFVQIAPYNYGPETNSSYLRDAQRKTMSLENTGMAVTLDIGDTNNIHPADKEDVGKRLALWALDKNYGENIVYSGPIYKSMKIRGNKIELEFESIGSGLVIKDGKNEFLICGENQEFLPAETKIDGNKLIVWSEKINSPKAVRYAWSNNAQATLFNQEGLPASSFRTDDWN